MVINAFSTFVAFFADVSKNSIPRESANSYINVIDWVSFIYLYKVIILLTFPWSKVTALLDVRSALFPTRSLLTFSLAYL